MGGYNPNGIPFGFSPEEQAEINRVKSLPEIQDAVRRICENVHVPSDTAQPTLEDLMFCRVTDTANPHIKRFSGVILCKPLGTEFTESDTAGVQSFVAQVDGYDIEIELTHYIF